MPWDNSLNPAKGRDFQRIAADVLGRHFNVKFAIDHPIPIGSPPKIHKFDLVARGKDGRQHVGECRNYSWTEGSNVPSAKMAFVNEAVLYLSLLPSSTHRFVVMPRSKDPKRQESLAEYYFRTYRHLLSSTVIIEVDPNTDSVRTFGAVTPADHVQ